MIFIHHVSMYNIHIKPEVAKMSDYTFNSIAVVHINPHRLRNILIISFSVIFIIVFFSSLSANKGLKAVNDSGSPEVYPFRRNILESFLSVSFFSSDKKVLLKGWMFKNTETKKAVIFVHDYSQNRLIFGDDTDLAINHCLKNGYNVLLFDQRNSGNVDASETTLGLNEKYDVEGAIAYAKALDMREIYIIGLGTGADAALYAAKQPEIKGMVLDSPYQNYKSALKYVLKMKDIKTVFFTKTLIKLFLRIYDGARQFKADDTLYKDMPAVLITRSGFSFLAVNEERKVYDDLTARSKKPVVLAAVSSDMDAIGYLDTAFAFFNEYTVESDMTNSGG
jgi:uncharacterized protein